MPLFMVKRFRMVSQDEAVGIGLRILRELKGEEAQ